MRGMILAAGRGERMRELTEMTPKPLLKVAGRYLIEYAISAFVKSGVRDIVINVCYRGDQIKAALGDGKKYDATFYYSDEEVALETGGGILQALPLLGSHPFIVLSCDVITNYDLKMLPQEPDGLAHLVLVDNPSFHVNGDFSLKDNRVFCAEKNTFTFGNVGVYRPELFRHCQPGKFGLGGLLKNAAGEGNVSGEYFSGVWHNVGTPEQLILAADCYLKN